MIRERREQDRGLEGKREKEIWFQVLCLALVIEGIWENQEANIFLSSRGKKFQVIYSECVPF